ncbi:hypothetical protein QF117_10525 [Vibrio sp. YMD68]|uniref:hypothetical protein n=1 Tax=Vibrio sp. YMD68 TaxID=3042300 RepID=UPI00249CE2C8|nr:hypothetical protein [Vibrio sp. YMD68]WGV98849.1 hypothetical protein QF117_02485 [Vibrio sp. YMD68]WGW01224.1 hypothetical protein QF117_10525 [Vibrio sp. YMD68]
MKARYSDIRSTLRTGDIVLFSGKGIVSTGIKRGQALLARFMGNRGEKNWKWSHIGIVLKLPAYDTVMLWESTTLSNIRCVELGRQHKGVQLVPLSERIASYDGEVCIRQLTSDIPELQRIVALSGLREKLKGAPYEKSTWQLIKSAYKGPFGRNKKDLSSVFCSELVAEAYQELGLLCRTPPSNEYSPACFADPQLTLNEAQLGPRILLC